MFLFFSLRWINRIPPDRWQITRHCQLSFAKGIRRN